MRIGDITDYLEGIAPLHLQEKYDNAGLIVGSKDTEVSGALCCLDATPEIIAEAREKGLGMVIAHHPIVFGGLKKINGKNYVERAVIDAIKSDIAIYAIHTNLDNVLDSGVNARIGQRLELQDVSILQPKDPREPKIGSGLIGSLSRSMPTMDFLAFLKEKMGASVIRHTALTMDAIQKVAVCGGSGSFLLDAAKAAGADIFITADYKYHQFFDADGDIIIADIGHYESEQFTIDLLAELLNEKFSNFAARKTESVTNPVKYFK
jgi:dinuclear metal center YbgI/SA1388 family protein